MRDLPVFPDLKGQSIFITGGGSGIGAAVTEAFLRQGAKVAFCQRSDASAFCDSMEQVTGNRPLFLPCDITNVAALGATLATAAASHGPISVLVNNAANDKRNPTLDTDEAFWDWSMAINLKSYFFACKAVLPAMRAMGGGAIINFSSISYMIPSVGFAPYITANAGITGLTRTLAKEFGRDRIRVNAIAPGWVLTPKQRELWVTPESLAEHMALQAIPDELVEADIVGGVLFLASASARMVTGQVMVIDGGVVVTG
ncbi:MAG: SDR family NAD(P)-dependent oxidoreductase [Paracoccaceae bacterium]